jgi:hypothetical protein
MVSTGWAIVLKSVVYVAAFWIFGWRIARKKLLPSLGWALLGGLDRWIVVLILVVPVHLLHRFRQPLGLVLGFMAIFRFAIWATLAGMLYESRRKHTLHFSLVMTLINFGFDLLIYGSPKPSDLLQPIEWGSGD